MVEELKMKYNYILNRYYNGCNYIEAHPDENSKYIDNIMDFKRQLEEILEQIENIQPANEDEILGGFKVC